MIEVNCYLCGSVDRIELFHQEGPDPYLEMVSRNISPQRLAWYVCKRCGFVYRSPMLDESELDRLYSNYEKDVFKGISPDIYFDSIINLPPERSENLQKTLWLGKTLTELQPSRILTQMSVLDVGCGGGTLLHTVNRELGMSRLFGVELNPAYAELAAQRVPINLRNEKYQHGMFDKQFDLIINTKVLEHVPDPTSFISEMSHDLSNDGVLFLEVPDLSDLFVLPASHSRFLIPHIYYYSFNTISELLRRCDLMICASRSVVGASGRAYFQALSMAVTDEVPPMTLPFDDPNEIISKIENRTV